MNAPPKNLFNRSDVVSMACMCAVSTIMTWTITTTTAAKHSIFVMLHRLSASVWLKK